MTLLRDGESIRSGWGRLPPFPTRPHLIWGDGGAAEPLATRAIPQDRFGRAGVVMHGLIRRLAIAAGAAALTLGTAAGAAITTATPAQADLGSCTGTCTFSSPLPAGEPDGVNPCFNDTYTVPADITVLHVTAIGQGGFGGESAGGSAFSGGGGGNGEKVETYLAVTPGEQLDVSAGDNGYGGLNGDPIDDNGGIGGDPSYISTEVEPSGAVESPCATGGFLVIAGGGGGGGGGAVFGNGGGGGDAGFSTGANGGGGETPPDNGGGGGGGTQTAGGSAGGQGPSSNNMAEPGSFLQGGCADVVFFLALGKDVCGGGVGTNQVNDTGGGGGGGYYGGGGGGDANNGGAGGGGGGSSFVDPSSVYFPLTNGSLTVSQGTTSGSQSVSITPVILPPGLPTNVNAIAGNQQATVSFSPPAYDGGAPVQYYTVYTFNVLDPLVLASLPHVQVTSSPVTIKGLIPGRYIFYVSATNQVGAGGTTTGQTAPVGVYRLPNQAVITSAMAGDGTVTVTASPAPSDESPHSGVYNPITKYTVVVRAGVGVTSGPSVATNYGTVTPVTDPNTGLTTYNSPPITVSGLTDGTNYTVTVYATNPAGDGPESKPAVVFPETVPGAPTNATATNATLPGAAAGTVNVSFTPPASNGGGGIASYTAVSSPGGITATGSGSPIQVTGLSIGTSYTFTVYATNPAGNGPPSDPSNAVTPAPLPSPPQVPGAVAVDVAPQPSSLPPPSPDLGAAYVSCLPPASNGGSPIVSYTVTSSPGGITATGSSCPVLVTGLTAGTPYTFTVTATNADGGTSQPSQSTTKVIPRVAPGGPEPANDNFAKAQAISGTSGSVSGTNVGATVETNEPNIQDNRGGASVWYKWVVPATGTYQFDTCTANPDVAAIIGAFTGNSVGNLTEYPGPGPSLDSCPGGEAGAIQIINPIAGQTIYIKFDGLNPDSNANPPYVGAFTLEWKQIS